jgi:hypothetical protein
MRFLVLLLAILILAGCGGVAGGAANDGAPRIALETAVLELGEMPNGQVAEREVTVRNDGDAPLVVSTVTTSCGCTTAALEPMTIAPGDSGRLRVAFDSGAHGPDLRGPLLREVMLASNDPATPEATVEIRAMILPPE